MGGRGGKGRGKEIDTGPEFQVALACRNGCDQTIYFDDCGKDNFHNKFEKPGDLEQHILMISSFL